MKRTLIIALALSELIIAQAFAAESAQLPITLRETFEQRQTRLLKMLDERIGSIEEERMCIGAAKNDDDLMTCSESQMKKLKEKYGEPKNKRSRLGNGQQGQ